jgi:hypothetical protein
MAAATWTMNRLPVQPSSISWNKAGIPNDRAGLKEIIIRG